jgi:hypothetical protein
MLADKRTGAGTINAPTLRSFIPELSYDAAKRVLHSLQEKRYIYRRITPYSKIVYPFWVNRYIPSAGLHKGLQIDLAKVFESKDIKDIAYVKVAPVDAPEGAPEGAPDPAPNYKKGEERQEKRNKTPISKSESASICASADEAKPSGVMTQAKHNMQGASALPSALPSKAQSGSTGATTQKHAKAASQVQTVVVDPVDYMTYAPSRVSEDVASAAGLAYRMTKTSYVDLATDRPVPWPDAILRLKTAVLRRQQTAS